MWKWYLCKYLSKTCDLTLQLTYYELSLTKINMFGGTYQPLKLGVEIKC